MDRLIMKGPTKLLLLLSLFLFSIENNAQITIALDSTVIEERIVVDSLLVPWEILWGPDDHIWMTERIGKISRVEPESGTIELLVDLQHIVSQDFETGLLGMELHPQFATAPFVFVVYTFEGIFEGEEEKFERLSRFTYSNDSLIDETILLDSLLTETRHCGSRILISDDNKLFMTIGDAARPENSQDTLSLDGKLLRMNLDGTIPNDNPYVDSYVYSYGHRNSQGIVFGPNGMLYSSEHGDDYWDEINIIEPRVNYGWPFVEGYCDDAEEENYCDSLDIREPIWQWVTCPAVNDIVFYQNDEIPEWTNKMLVASLGGFNGIPGINVLTFNDDGTEVLNDQVFFSNYGRIRDVCINPANGAIYFATNGEFYPGEGPNCIVEYKPMEVSGVNENEHVLEKDLMVLKQNPIQSGMPIELTFNFNTDPYSFEIYTNEGKKMMSKKIEGDHEYIETIGWEAGIYNVHLKTKTGYSILKRVVVQ